MEQAPVTSNFDEINIAIMNARRQGNEAALIQALEGKIKLLVSLATSLTAISEG
jgi:hypothetical protein